MKIYCLNTIKKLRNANSNMSYKYVITIIIQVCIIVISLGIPILKKDQSFSTIVVSGILLIIINIVLLLRKSNLTQIKFNKMYLILLEFIGISFVFNGTYFGVMGYVAIGITFSIILPFLNISFSSNYGFSICRAICIGILISFILFCIISILFGPMLGVTQYTSVLSNPNTLGNYIIIVISALIYLFFDLKKSKSKYFWGYAILFGMAISMALYTNSRTTLIAISMQIVIVFLMCTVSLLVNNEKQKFVRLIKKSSILVIVSITVFVTMFFVLTDLKKSIIEIVPVIQSEDVNEDISFEEYMKIMKARYMKGINKEANIKSEGKNEDLDDQFTSGRKEIWRSYIESIEIIGHPEEGRKIIEKNRVYMKTNAHNVYIQMAYSAGCLVGIAMLVLMLTVAKDLLVRIYRFIKMGILEKDLIFTICSSIGFVVVSLTSGGYMVFTYLPVTMFYFSLYTLSIKKENRK